MKTPSPTPNSSVTGHRKKQVKSLGISSEYERDFTGTYMGRKIDVSNLNVPEELLKADAPTGTAQPKAVK